MSKSDDEIDRAFQEACRALSFRSLSKKEIEEKLKGLGCKDDSIRTTLEQLLCLGYINDLDLGETIARSMAERGYGPLRAQQKLWERGLDRDCAHNIVEEVYRNIDLVEMATYCAARREQRILHKPIMKRKLAIARHLAGRGFSMECVRMALEEIYGNEP